VRVRASVLYELCVETRWPVHAKGVQLGGAWIPELLDFEGAALRVPLALVHCNIASIRIAHAVASVIQIARSVIREGLEADMARLAQLSLRGSTAKTLRLRGATIEGHLDLIDAKFKDASDEGYSLTADALHVGEALLRGDVGQFTAAGSVRLVGATVDRDLDLSGAVLGTDADGDSLVADRVRVGGDVALRDGFAAGGAVSFVGAAIDGQLRIHDTERIDALRLASARCAVLVDDKDSWPESGRLWLRDFRFDVLGNDADYEQRLEWVRRQGFVDWSPDPYQQLATYYSSTGDDAAARRMRIAKNDDELKHLKKTQGWRSLWRRFWRRLYGCLVGYGYRRWPAGVLLVIALVGAGVLFLFAERDGAMFPNEPATDDAGNALPCGEAYPCFNSWLYGADVVLPIIDFGQDDAWRPVETAGGNQWWIWARWAFIIIGWTLASVFVVAFTALVQRG
jgi:hypothetical protein